MVNRFVKLTPKLCIMGKLLFECFVLAKPTKMKSVGPKNKSTFEYCRRKELRIAGGLRFSCVTTQNTDQDNKSHG